MKRFMLLHYGFEKPSPEVMDRWNAWFEANKDRTVENGGFHGAAREITHEATRDLEMNMEAITGYSIIQAEDVEEAEAIARDNPFIAGIRVYEIMGQ